MYWKETTTDLLPCWPPHPGPPFTKYYKYTESVDTFVYCFLFLVPRKQAMHFGMAMDGGRYDTNRHIWRRTWLLLTFIILLFGKLKDQACAELHPHLNKMWTTWVVSMENLTWVLPLYAPQPRRLLTYLNTGRQHFLICSTKDTSSQQRTVFTCFSHSWK